MISQKLCEIIEVPGGSKTSWPSYFVVTDRGVYKFTGQQFVRCTQRPKGRPLPLGSEWSKQRIREIRGDGEIAVILLDRGDKVVFELSHDPFDGKVESWPVVRFCTLEQSRSWEDEYCALPTIECYEP